MKQKNIPAEVIRFFKKQSFAIVVTADKTGKPNISAKGIVEMGENGYVYLLDLYDGNTHRNLKLNPKIAIAAIDEHKFAGWELKGHAEEILYEGPEFEKALPVWEKQVISRVTTNIIKSLQEGSSRRGRSEAELPKPKYLIKMKVTEVISLSPQPSDWVLKNSKG